MYLSLKNFHEFEVILKLNTFYFLFFKSMHVLLLVAFYPTSVKGNLEP